MIKHFLNLIFLGLCGSVLAGGLPKNTEVTPENAEALSIKLTKMDSGSSNTYLYRLEFADQLEGCLAGRVQTALINGDKEISASSMDYQVGSAKPNVLLHMPASGYDMAVTLQYCCSGKFSPGCKEALSIESVKGLARQ